MKAKRAAKGRAVVMWAAYTGDGVLDCTTLAWTRQDAKERFHPSDDWVPIMRKVRITPLPPRRTRRAK